MKKDGKYRFSLQFAADTEEQVKAGELLERLGNKKSSIVVVALNEYLSAHPELQNVDCKIEVRIASGYNRDRIEQMIRAMVEEKFAAFQISSKAEGTSDEAIPDVLEDDVAQMLDNLDLFQ